VAVPSQRGQHAADVFLMPDLSELAVADAEYLLAGHGHRQAGGMPSSSKVPVLVAVMVQRQRTCSAQRSAPRLDNKTATGLTLTVQTSRTVSLGATRINIGQGEVSWVVMADPDGHEFCVLTPDSATRSRVAGDPHNLYGGRLSHVRAWGHG
jgi:Glyoxalase-like domain